MLKKFIPQKPAPRAKIPSPGSSFAEEQPTSFFSRGNTETTNQTSIKNIWPNILAKTSSRVMSRSKEASNFRRSLLIDGKVEGEINSDGVLTIGENADIRGEIKTKSITVFGKVHGNITVDERCELKSRCTLQGDLKAARLVIEEGATFIGKSEVTSGKVAPAPNRREPARDRAQR